MRDEEAYHLKVSTVAGVMEGSEATDSYLIRVGWVDLCLSEILCPNVLLEFQLYLIQIISCCILKPRRISFTHGECCHF